MSLKNIKTPKFAPSNTDSLKHKNIQGFSISNPDSGFAEIDLETLCAVLERDTLRVREAPLFQALVRWATEECHRQQLPVIPDNQRAVLGRALGMIRFPLMTVEEFAQNAGKGPRIPDTRRGSA
jgi:hypothetical protein